MQLMAWITAAVGPDRIPIAWWQVGVRGLIVFFVGLAMMRLAGPRTFIRGSPLDTVVAVVIGSNLSRALAGSTPFWPMLGVSVLMVALHGLLAHATIRVPWLGFLVKRPPVAVVKDGAMDASAMRAEAIDQGDIEASLREHELVDLSLVRLATLEGDGKISVVRVFSGRTPE
jgi:uncharacterized membrane protein YcaP (DUF421 family)